jgi:phospholipid/cholesterol/gamma-HCH transport system substrate-binding protein
MSKQTINTLVGALVVAVGVLAFILSQRANHGDVPTGYELKASFGSIDGVTKDTKILLTGIQVGTVTSFRYNESRQRAIVEMTIKDGIEIPVDSVVMIVTDGLLGGKYLKIQPGGDTAMMKPGTQFDYTQDSIVFEEILEKVILNAEKTRQKEKEDKQKQEKEQPTEKKPNRASNETTAFRVAASNTARSWVNK